MPEIVITLACTAEERARVIELIQNVMRDRFGGEAPPTRGIILNAQYDGEIVGAIALEGSNENARFPIEEHYRFADTAVAFPCERDRIIQGSRWVAVRSGVSFKLLTTALAIGRCLGKRYMLVEAKPYGIRRVNEFGISTNEIFGAFVDMKRVTEMIGEKGAPYYRSAPRPKLYLISTERLDTDTW